ncbi:MAG: substrate-binding domain-containing protein [Clostridia bacterium]|nr:substrate-binding domain-containing protein [Clostridia bacterium]
MKKLIALLAALALLLTCGCGAQPSTEPTAPAPTATDAAAETPAPRQTDFQFTLNNYPRMGGSLANLPLGEAITASVLGVTRDEADDLITFAGSTTDNYKAIVDGGFDILLAYEPSEEAKEYIKEKNVELEMTPIGVDALVFICSLENEVKSLTIDQIKDIYRGKITNWSEVGGDDDEILAYQRNKDSGSQTLFDKLINLGDELMTPPSDMIVGSMIGLLEAVADYDNSEDALGYTVYYYLTNMETDKLKTSKILDVNGVTPSNETIGSGDYPLTNDFYVVIRKDAEENSPERILYNWICSDQGHELVVRENYPTRK